MMHDDPSDEELNKVSNRSANTPTHNTCTYFSHVYGFTYIKITWYPFSSEYMNCGGKRSRYEKNFKAKCIWTTAFRSFLVVL